VLSYEILNAASETLLVTGRTTLICVNGAGEVCRLPAEWRENLTRRAAAYGAGETF
jgi:acyl-CoA thioesterase FadM